MSPLGAEVFIDGARCLDAGMKGLCTAGSLNASKRPPGFALFMVVPAEVVGRCSSAARLRSGKDSVRSGAADNAGDEKPP